MMIDEVSISDFHSNFLLPPNHEFICSVYKDNLIYKDKSAKNLPELGQNFDFSAYKDKSENLNLSL